MADDTPPSDQSDTAVSSNSIEKVCEFLTARGLAEEVVERFRYEKMDAPAITNAKDDLLKEMGLSKAGDRLSLKGFCTQQKDESNLTEGNKDRKRALLEAFLSRKKDKKRSKSTSFNRTSNSVKQPEKGKTKKVQLGWKHFKEQEEVYVLVPLTKGGGSRVVEMPLSSNKMNLYEACKSLFFPEGMSIFGKEDDMIFNLTNFKGEKIEATIKVGKEELPFNLCNYMEAHKIKTVRLYLQSKRIDGSDDDEIALPIMLETNNDISLIGSTQPRQSIMLEQDRKYQDFLNPETNNETSMIGTTQERRSLMLKQDREYQESLKADKKKAVSVDKETSDAKRKERVQHARTDRVIPEPDSNFVTVKVRHVTMGLLSRRFPSSANMSAVYDWAGSLSTDPENFILCDHFGVQLLPSCTVSDRCTLSMIETENGTPSMSESDDEIQFLGFGDASTVCRSPTLSQETLTLKTIADDEEQKTGWLDNYYASILDISKSDPTDAFACFEDDDNVSFNGDTNEDVGDQISYRNVEDEIDAESSVQKQELHEILGHLATEIDQTNISKFNISRSFIWEGAKRALARKSFSAKNKMSVKFTDDVGNSEGAVDMGGPMKEFFTLVIQWLLTSQLFCGHEHHKFLSFQSRCLEENDYYFAGVIIAMSLVHGGPGPQCLASNMFEALINDPDKVSVSVEDVYDIELQSSLQTLQNSTSKEEAAQVMNDAKLLTILDLAGTLQPIQTTADIEKIAVRTAKWFILGRAQAAIESFENGLATLGVLDALKENPDAFRPTFCYYPAMLTAEIIESLFRVSQSPVGSNKAVTESLVLSRWHDYLQDIEEDEDSITLSDIFFFATGCKVLPARKIYPSIQFLHQPEACGEKSKFPKANTCSNILYLPVVHATYDVFKVDMSFGIQNGRGFGIA